MELDGIDGIIFEECLVIWYVKDVKSLAWLNIVHSGQVWGQLLQEKCHYD